MVYNISYISANSTSFYDIVLKTDETLTGGVFMTLFFFACLTVMFLAFIHKDVNATKAFAVITIVSTPMALILGGLGLIPGWVLTLSIVGSGLCMAFMWKR